MQPPAHGHVLRRKRGAARHKTECEQEGPLPRKRRTENKEECAVEKKTMKDKRENAEEARTCPASEENVSCRKAPSRFLTLATS